MSKKKPELTPVFENDVAAESFDTDAAIDTEGRDMEADIGYEDSTIDLAEQGDL